MKIIFKNQNDKFFKSISLKGSEIFQLNFAEFNSLKNLHEAHIFAINEIITSQQLKDIKIKLTMLNLESLYVFSNKRETILTGKSLKIDSILLNEKELKHRLILSEPKDQKEALYKRTIRSGDRICSNGDLFIFGDVNPGAIISAKKNIYVWGKLLGIAYAGEDGNNNAFIASLYLNPLQIRINEVIAIGPKEKPKYYYPEMAILEKKSIVIKPYLMDASK